MNILIFDRNCAFLSSASATDETMRPEGSAQRFVKWGKGVKQAMDNWVLQIDEAQV